MECILHIGTEKTGSTTLQEFFHVNRSLLRNNGIIYTKSLGEKANNEICLISYPLDRRDNLTEKAKIKSNDDLKEKQENLVKKFKKELNGIEGNKVVISSELIQSRLINDEDVLNLKQVLEDVGFKTFKIVVYLRNPSDIAQSLYSTALKFGHSWDSPPPPTDNYFQNICNHKATLMRFGNVFGVENLKPRLFERNKMVGGSIVSDFFDAIGESIPLDAMISNDSNPSLSYTGTVLLSKINKSWTRTIDGVPNFKRSDLVKFFEKFLSTSKFKLPSNLRNEYDDFFKDSNSWVRENFFSEKEHLFYNEGNCLNEANSLDVNELSELIMDLWSYKYRQPKYRLLNFYRELKFKLKR